MVGPANTPSSGCQPRWVGNLSTTEEQGDRGGNHLYSYGRCSSYAHGTQQSLYRQHKKHPSKQHTAIRGNTYHYSPLTPTLRLTCTRTAHTHTASAIVLGEQSVVDHEEDSVSSGDPRHGKEGKHNVARLGTQRKGAGVRSHNDTTTQQSKYLCVPLCLCVLPHVIKFGILQHLG